MRGRRGAAILMRAGPHFAFTGRVGDNTAPPFSTVPALRARIGPAGSLTR